MDVGLRPTSPAAGRRCIGAPVLGRCGVRRLDKCDVSMGEAKSGAVRLEGVGTSVLKLVPGRLSESVRGRLETARLDAISGADVDMVDMCGIDGPENAVSGMDGLVTGTELSSSQPDKREGERGRCDNRFSLRLDGELGATINTSCTTVGTVGMTAVILADTGRLWTISEAGVGATRGGAAVGAGAVSGASTRVRVIRGLGASMPL